MSANHDRPLGNVDGAGLGTTMKMHLLPCGRLRMRKSIFLPAAGRGETIELPVSSGLLRHPQGNVLFDTGCHPAVPEDPEGRWGALAKLMVPIMQPQRATMGRRAQGSRRL